MKEVIKPAENPRCLHSDSFEVNTSKSQANKSVLVSQLQEILSLLESDQKSAKHISGEVFAESEVLLLQHKEYNTGNTTQKLHTTTRNS